MTGELIADGVHLHPAMVRLLIRLLGPERAVLISDALVAERLVYATDRLRERLAAVPR